MFACCIYPLVTILHPLSLTIPDASVKEKNGLTVTGIKLDRLLVLAQRLFRDALIIEYLSMFSWHLTHRVRRLCILVCLRT